MLKGFTVLWVIWMHLELPEIIDPAVQMPVFFFLSGLFFSVRPTKEFLIRKVNTLIIPLLFFWFLSWISQVIYQEFIPCRFVLSKVDWGNVFNIFTKYSYLKVNILWFLMALFACNVLYFFLLKIVHNQHWLLLFVSIPPFIVFCYLITPYFIRLQNYKKGIWQIIIIILCVSLLIVNNYIPIFKSLHHLYVGLYRIPVFLTGCYLGKFVYQNKRMPTYFFFFAVVLFFILTFLLANTTKGQILWLLYLPFSIAICIVFSKIFEYIKIPFLGTFGIVSLECYLLHESLILNILSRFVHNKALLLIIPIIVTVILAKILHESYNKLLHHLSLKKIL
jgi:fucose 4-O-acetylase-like acetyltransferase